MQASLRGATPQALHSCGRTAAPCSCRQRRPQGVLRSVAPHAQQQQRVRQIVGRLAGRFCGDAAALRRSCAPSLPPRGRQAACSTQASANILPASDILAAIKIPPGRDMAGEGRLL